MTAIGVSTRSATSTASHIPANASAARCSNDSHARPFAGLACSAIRWIVASNLAPITSGNWPCSCNIPVSFAHHIRNDRASNRARPSTNDGFTFERANRARSPGATFGARTAHSASDSASASRTTAPSCSALRVPARAAAATDGSDSNARAVSTFA